MCRVCYLAVLHIHCWYALSKLTCAAVQSRIQRERVGQEKIVFAVFKPSNQNLHSDLWGLISRCLHQYASFAHDLEQLVAEEMDNSPPWKENLQSQGNPCANPDKAQ